MFFLLLLFGKLSGVEIEFITFRSCMVSTPSPVLSTFLKASPITFFRLADIGGCN